jgi:hypothetical protein
VSRDEERRTPTTPPQPRPTRTREPRDDTGRDTLEPESQPAGQIGFPVAPVRPPVADRGLAIAAGIVALVVGLAVVKPWGTATGPAPAPPRPVAGASTGTSTNARTPRPTADTSAEGVAGPVCLGASGWRIASLEAWRAQDVRVWRAIEPLPTASGPSDATIPTVPVVGFEVEALGWCAPAYGPDRPVGPAQVDAWILLAGVVHELELRRVLPARGETHLAGLYVPVARCPVGARCGPTDAPAVVQPWVTGRVVFRYEDGGTGESAWFGAEVELYQDEHSGAPGTARPSTG